QPERDVVAAVTSEPVELAAHAERDRGSRVTAALADPETQVLAVANRREVRELAAVDEQDHTRVAEPERRETAELGAEVEVELAAGHDRVDARHRLQVVLSEHGVRMRRER